MRSRALVCLLGLSAGLLTGAAPAAAQSGSGTISGTVTDAQGEPVGGICVEVFGVEFDYVTTETASDGGYSVDVTAPDQYTVGFGTCEGSTSGFAPEWYDDVPSQEDATLVPVDNGQTVTGINAALDPAGSFSGTVVDDDTGKGLEGVCVIGFDPSIGSYGESVTDADGTYLVPDVPAGEYIVVFGDCADPLVHITEFYDDVQVDNGEPTAEPTPVVVSSGEDTSGIDAGLAEGGALQGVVTALHTGEEQPLVCVAVYDAAAQSDDAPVALGLSGLSPTQNGLEPSAGRFTLPGLVPGDYVVAFNPGVCEDDGYVSRWFDGGATRDEASVLTVVKGEVQTGIDTVVTPLPSISFACPFDVDPSEAPFSDVPEGNVHKRAIECLELFGVVAGRGDGTYGPAVPVNRAQMASFVARTLEAAGGQLPEDPPNAFDDDNGSIHERAIDQLAALGVVAGKGGRRYAPAETVNRAQMATFLVNTYEEATGVALREAGDQFADDAGNVHEAAINKVATAGITAGTGSGYAPTGIVRRDQMASFLARLLDRVQRDTAYEFFTEQPPTGGGPSLSSFAVTQPRGDVRRTRELPVTGLRRLIQDAAVSR